jgi:hypothetical protein
MFGAVCEGCGITFPSGFAIEKPEQASQMTIENSFASPCPNCGERGLIKTDIILMIN